MSFSGSRQCRDSVNYERLMDAAGTGSLNYKVSRSDESFGNSGEYQYETTRSLRSLDRFEDSSAFRYDWDLKRPLTMDVDANFIQDRLIIKKCTNSTNDSTTSFETVTEMQEVNMNWTICYKAIAFILFVLALLAPPACGSGSGGGGDASAECIEALEEVEGLEGPFMELVKSESVSDWSDDELVESAFLFAFADGDTVEACEGLMDRIDQEGQKR